jgi:predicted nuclease of restriction endonuclease-like (RecB) superfamily
LSWTHFRTLIYIGDPLARLLPADVPAEGWSTRSLQERLDSSCSSAPRFPPARCAAGAGTGQPAPARRADAHAAAQRPYVLDFLGLNDRYLERPGRRHPAS